MWFSVIFVYLTNIETGQQITVLAQKDIKDTKQFKAIEITVQSEPVMQGREIISPEEESAPED